MLQEFTQAIEETARAVVDEIHTALPGKIVSFNANKGIATVQPYGKFVTSNGRELSYPRITEVPVVFPFCQQNGVGMVFPVCSGDSCIIIVSEVELDEWRSGAESEGPLRFDLTSAMAIPGLLSKGGDMVAKAVKEKAVVLGAGTTEVVVSTNGVNIDVEGTTFAISKTGIIAGGDFKVEGNFSYTGEVTKVY